MKKIGKWILIVLILALLGIAAGLFAREWHEKNTDHSGWVEENGLRCYLDFHGDRVTGWQEIDGARYYLGQDGAMQTGWQEIEGQRYYFGTDGKMAVGWQQIDDSRCYLGSDGVPVTGWLEQDGQRYYLDGDGSPVTGAVTLEEERYFFREDGTMLTGWMEKSYYFSDGTLATHWQDIDGQRYYFDENGTLYTGWLEQGEYSYYLKEDGSMAVGPCEIDGKTYFFTPDGIHLWLVNPWNYLHEDYEVELEQVVAGYRVASVCKDALNKMLEDCKAAGLNPELISGYRTYWDQQALYMEKIAEYGVTSGSQIVAKPNTSEHQLGLAVDIVASGNYTLNKSQGDTRVQLWLMEHCWDYGFILRYPEGTTEITGIIYEPWHYRYVGVEIALELKELGITLEEYLGAVAAE